MLLSLVRELLDQAPLLSHDAALMPTGEPFPLWSLTRQIIQCNWSTAVFQTTRRLDESARSWLQKQGTQSLDSLNNLKSYP